MKDSMKKPTPFSKRSRLGQALVETIILLVFISIPTLATMYFIMSKKMFDKVFAAIYVKSLFIPIELIDTGNLDQIDCAHPER